MKKLLSILFISMILLLSGCSNNTQKELRIIGADSIKVGDSSYLHVEDNVINWTSSNNKIASINNNGKVTGISEGNVVITAILKNNTLTHDLSVIKKEINLQIEGPNIIELGKSATLTAIITPDNNQNVLWKSSDSTIVSIDSYGTVTGLKEGNAIITATCEGKEESIIISVEKKENIVHVTDIKITGSTSVKVGSSITLKASITPSNATNNNVTWTSSDNSIANVDKNGIVKGINKGKVIITAKCDGISKTININVEENTVTIHVNKITINGNSKIELGKTIKLTTIIDPNNATITNVNWSSSNTNIATINSSGEVTPKAVGTVTITAECDGKTATKKIEVYKNTTTIPVSSVSITGASETTLGNTITLTANITPSNATNKTVNWTSSNNNIATVNNGVVTPKSTGTVTITAECDEKTATKPITVKSSIVSVTSITLTGSNSVNVGSTIQIVATVSPSNATNKTLTWSSSNTNVAVVNNGVVTGKSAGRVAITATANNGVSKNIMIDVTNPVQDFSIIQQKTQLNVGEVFTYTTSNNGRTITWSSSNSNVLSITSQGVATAKAAGTVTLTVTDGFKTSNITVKVVQTDSQSGSGDSANLTMRVLVIVNDPILRNSTIDGRSCTNIHVSECFGQNRQQAVDELVTDIKYSSHNTVNVKIIKTEELNEFPKYKTYVTLKNGSKAHAYDEETYAYKFKNGWYSAITSHTFDEIGAYEYDYEYLINKFNLVSRSKNNEFDQVWLVTIDPTNDYESILVGKNAYWVNGAQIEKDCPIFPIVNVSISRPDVNFECFGHYVENVLNTTYSKTNYSGYNALSWGKNSTTINSSNYSKLSKFQKFMLTEWENTNKNSGYTGVGNMHYSPNSTSDYNWNNPDNNVLSKWEEFKTGNITNNPSTKKFTASTYMNTSLSGTNSDARHHHRWWFGLFPYQSGYDENGYSNTWWRYFIRGKYVKNVTGVSVANNSGTIKATFKITYVDDTSEIITPTSGQNYKVTSNKITYIRDGISASLNY